MAAGTLTLEDRKIRDAVGREIERDPDVDASGIGITARSHVVTLTGFVDSCAAKLAAERAARRVHGVLGVANDVQVRSRLPRTDAEVAADAVRALELHGVLTDGIQVVVHDQHVTLTGRVRTTGDRIAAAKALRHLRGAKGIVNRVRVAAGPSADEVNGAIARALHPSGQFRTHGIEVTVADRTVTLTGKVHTWLEREAAERAARHAAGVKEVVNQITVEWPHDPPAPIEDECE